MNSLEIHRILVFTSHMKWLTKNETDLYNICNRLIYIIKYIKNILTVRSNILYQVSQIYLISYSAKTYGRNTHSLLIFPYV